MRVRLAVGITAMTLGLGGETRAQIAVFDGAAVARLASQIQTMQAQLQQLQQTYQAVAHLPSQTLQQLGQGFNVSSFRNALPTNPGAVAGMLNGSGDLTASGQTYLEANRVYVPAGTDFAAQEIQRKAASIAGAQGLSSDLYTSASARITALQGLEGELATASDAKQVADIQARVATEQAYIQAQQVQAQSLIAWQDAAGRSDLQRREEQRRQEIDQVIADVQAHGG